MILFCPVYGQDDIDVQNLFNGSQTNYSINAGGGEALGQQGNSSYSIGQIFATQVFKQEGQIDNGVQQGISMEVAESIIDVKDSLSSNILAYPNPVNNILYLNTGGQDYSNLSFQVLDLSGKVITNGIIENSISEIELSYLKSGIYLLVVNRKDEFLVSLKLIKK